MNHQQQHIYLSELKTQIECIDRELALLADKSYQGALSSPCTAKDRDAYHKLKARRKVLIQRIIWFESPQSDNQP